RIDSPRLALRLFKRKLVALGIAASWIAFLANAATIFLMSFYLQKVLGYSPREAGLIVIPGAVCLAIAGLISGRLSDRLGWRTFNLAGLTISAVALFALSRYLTVASPLTLIVPLLMLNSAGGGMFNTPNNNSILSAVERSRYGIVSALTQVTRNSANITSIALATTIVVATMGSMGFEASLDAVGAEGGAAVAEAFLVGLKRVYLVFGSVLIVGIVISYLKGDRAKEPADQPAETVAAEPSGRS
ncbi:MAG: MFS transporter, partial [Chloroflexi bacterium]|nr:MFS transporter [Chloroflexota bacterium]